jgi:hypothetical protein
MCDLCGQLDDKIERCRRLIGHGLDSLTVERIKGLIRELEQRKEAMHL